MKRKEISDAWMREYMGPTSSGIGDGIMHSSLTFCGALEKFYNSISKHWNNETRTKVSGK